MRKRRQPAIGLLILLLVSLTSAQTEQDLMTMVQKARLRREGVRNYFLKIYEGSPELCAPVPEPTPSEKIAEDCLKGYNTGLALSLDHAELTSESPLPFTVQQNRMFCQNGYFLESPLSLFHSCAAKGMKDGFHYWFNVVRNPREKKSKMRDISREKEVDRIVKKVWTEMLKRKKQGLHMTEGWIFIEGSKVRIPKGMAVPNPEGLMVENNKDEGGAIVSPHKRLEATEDILTKERLIQSYTEQLERDDGKFQSSLPSDPEEKCQQNRIFLLHKAMNGQLENCKGVAEFQQQGFIVLSSGEATLDELEYMNRLLLEVTINCGVVKYANDIVPKSLNSPLSQQPYSMAIMHSLLI